MQEQTGEIFDKLSEAEAKAKGLVELKEKEYEDLKKVPLEQRTSQFHFDKWLEIYHLDVDGDTKSKLRHAYKNGFAEAERIYRK